MAVYDRNLGVWKASDGTSGFGSRAEAEAYEDTGARDGPVNDTSDFGRFGASITEATGPIGQLPERTIAEQEQEEISRLAREERERLSSVPYGTPAEQGGTATTYQVERPAIQASGRVTENVVRQAPAATARPAGTGSGNEELALNNIESSEGQRNVDRGRLTDLYEQSRFESDQNSAQSREAQQEGIQKNRQLYDILTQFDPEAYAEDFSARALQNTSAIARSATGGAESQQAAMFSALEQAPAISAEGQRMADDVEARRLGQAAGVAEQFGSLATGTRQQDVGENQLKSDFGIRIAQGIGDAIGQDWQLDSQDSALLAEVALALDAQDIQWANLSLQQQIAEMERILAEKGLDQKWRMFEREQKLNEKDIFGGLMSILGTGIEGGFKLAGVK